MNEWYEKFIAKVEKMREAQKMFFKTRDPQWFHERERLEAEVDDLIMISKMPSDIPADN